MRHASLGIFAFKKHIQRCLISYIFLLQGIGTVFYSTKFLVHRTTLPFTLIQFEFSMHSPIITNIELKKSLAQSRHEAIPHHQTSRATIHIYTDGSNIEAKVGAAAFSATLNKTTTSHLGSNSHSNIFAAELEGINLGLKQWDKVQREYPHCHIFTDSQAACIAVSHQQSGQSRIKEILDRLDSILQGHSHRQLHITWIPGHYNIFGNEQADKAAKHIAKNSDRHLANLWRRSIETMQHVLLNRGSQEERRTKVQKASRGQTEITEIDS